MKRLHGAAVLAAAAMFTASMGITGMADTSGAGENGSRLDGMVCMDGSVISAEDGRLHLNRRVEGGMTEVVVNLSEDTKILDAVNGFPVSVENLDDGEAVRVYTGPAMTLSLPPITNGLLVLADAPADSGFPVYAVVESLTQEPDKADGTEAAYILETVHFSHDMALFTSRIPFQYKCASIQGKTVIHPEFTTCGLSSSSPPAKPMTPLRLPIPPSRIMKNNGHKCMFFPQCPKIIGKPQDFSGFSYGLGIYLLFLCVCPKSTGILGIAGKNSLLCPGNEA